MQPRHQATLTQPFQCDLQPQLQETDRTTHTGTTTRCRTQRRNPIASGTTAAATAAHMRYLSSPAAATLHRKMQGFVLQLPPQNKAHATFMQPFQCDLQPQLQETHRTAHTGTTTRCRPQRRNQSRPERPQPQPPHTRGTFHRRLQPLYTEKYKVSCSSFLPKTKPMQHSCILTTSLRHHLPKSPLPFITSPLPFVTTSHRHHFPSSPLPIVTTSLPHHFPSSPPFVIASYSFVMYCYVMYCYVIYLDKPL